MIVLLVILFFLLKAVWRVYEKEALTRDNLAKTAAIYESLEARRSSLSAEINRLKTEAGQEEEIREKYGLVRPGEEVIVMVNKGANSATSSAYTSGGFWQKMLSWFR